MPAKQDQVHDQGNDCWNAESQCVRTIRWIQHNDRSGVGRKYQDKQDYAEQGAHGCILIQFTEFASMTTGKAGAFAGRAMSHRAGVMSSKSSGNQSGTVARNIREYSFGDLTTSLWKIKPQKSVGLRSWPRIRGIDQS